jgi:hypothetical protein
VPCEPESAGRAGAAPVDGPGWTRRSGATRRASSSAARAARAQPGLPVVVARPSVVGLSCRPVDRAGPDRVPREFAHSAVAEALSCAALIDRPARRSTSARFGHGTTGRRMEYGSEGLVDVDEPIELLTSILPGETRAGGQRLWGSRARAASQSYEIPQFRHFELHVS